MNAFVCRFCNSPLSKTFVDLGVSPVANAMIPADKPNVAEQFYPLHVYICQECLLVQIPNTVDRAEIFNDAYTYYSSFSASWLAHAKAYVDMATTRFALNQTSLVIELASNDGYLLKNFVNKDIPVLGIDPCANVAEFARKDGVATLVEFFGIDMAQRLAKEGKLADLVIANNVLAHVPDINDFVGGIARILKPSGVITAEFPHIVNLIEKNQFDTIYHEHYSYYSFHTIEKIFRHHGITLFDVEELTTHGGSLRIYGKLASSAPEVRESVTSLKKREKSAGYTTLDGYTKYQEKVAATKRDLLGFLIRAKREGKSIVGYGAAAKGNTFLNYCGIRTDFLDYVVDDSPYKQKHLLPGTRIPVYSSQKITQTKPDYVLILPWNLKTEIAGKLSAMRKWGGSCIVAIPTVEVLPL